MKNMSKLIFAAATMLSGCVAPGYHVKISAFLAPDTAIGQVGARSCVSKFSSNHGGDGVTGWASCLRTIPDTQIVSLTPPNQLSIKNGDDAIDQSLPLVVAELNRAGQKCKIVETWTSNYNTDTYQVYPLFLCDPATLHSRTSRANFGLGIRIEGVRPLIAKRLGFGPTHPGGALVVAVLPNSSSARAGLQSGDVIFEANGTRIKSVEDLPKIVAETASGSMLILKISRSGKEQTIAATVGKIPNT